MKKLIQTLALILAVVTMPALANAKKATKEVTYKVSLDCQSCVDKVMKNIPYEKGVKDVKVSLEKQEVTVVFVEDKNCPVNLKKAIEKLGYAVEMKNTPCCPKSQSSCCEKEKAREGKMKCCKDK